MSIQNKNLSSKETSLFDLLQKLPLHQLVSIKVLAEAGKTWCLREKSTSRAYLDTKKIIQSMRKLFSYHRTI